MGVFVAVLMVGGYQLLRRSQKFNSVYPLLPAAILAIVVGRLVEQMVDIARISGFNHILGVAGCIRCIASNNREPWYRNEPGTAFAKKRRRLNPPLWENRSNQWRHIGQLALIGLLITGIAALTWMKGVNYVRAAVVADRASEQFRAGDYQSALNSLERSIDLAPDVNSYYGLRSNVYGAFQSFDLVSQHPNCGGLAEPRARNVCLAEEVYRSNLEWVDRRPLSFQSRMALADSAFNLANIRNDINLVVHPVIFD